MENLKFSQERVVIVICREISGKCPYCGSEQVVRIDDDFEDVDSCYCSECFEQYGLENNNA